MGVKNKKAVLVVVSLIVLVLIVGLIIAAIKNKDNKEEKEISMPSKFTISYCYGGGFTTYANSLNRCMSVDQDGNVKIELTIDDSKVKPLEFKVEAKDAKTLMRYFYDNEFYNLKKDLSKDDVTDLDTSYLEVESNTFNRKVGGYAASIDSKFRKFSNKVYELVGEEKVNEFSESVIKAYEKSNE